MALATDPLLDDDTIGFGEEDESGGGVRKLTHPYVTFFHLAFRGSAIVVYVFCGLFSDSFIASFVTVILLLSMDFWTVKNITGRLMVGLRWWNYVDDDGKSHWVFESRKGNQQNRVNPSESRIFWLALVLCPIFWGVLFLIALFGFKFKWLLLVSIALVLNGANLYGYIKCKVGHGENITSSFTNLTSNFFRNRVLQSVTTMMSNATSQSASSNTPATTTNII